MRAVAVEAARTFGPDAGTKALRFLDGILSALEAGCGMCRGMRSVPHLPSTAAGRQAGLDCVEARRRQVAGDRMPLGRGRGAARFEAATPW